jgi:hypothetical protein
VGWLGGWAPGGSGQDFPAGTGIEILPGSKVIVQIHYNTLKAPAGPDQSKIAVKIDTSVQKKAAVVPFADVQWVSGGMLIPAHSEDVVHAYSADPTKLVNFITNGALSGGKPLTLYAAGTHMHGPTSRSGTSTGNTSTTSPRPRRSLSATRSTWSATSTTRAPWT